MSVVTFEATVEGGQIRLPDDLRLPDKTKVYVLVPGLEVKPVARIVSPRLAHPEQTAAFRMEVREEVADAAI